jgi:hypothetical protein
MKKKSRENIGPIFRHALSRKKCKIVPIAPFIPGEAALREALPH